MKLTSAIARKLMKQADIIEANRSHLTSEKARKEAVSFAARVRADALVYEMSARVREYPGSTRRF